MKKQLLIPLLLLIPVLLLGCSAESTQTANVEAADAAPEERPSQLAELPAFPPKYCPVTQPPSERFIPPEPYKGDPYPGQFYYGTAELWTAIPENQSWEALPYDPEHGYGQKLFYQRDGYDWLDEPIPALTVTGRRIDPEPAEETVTMTAVQATNAYTERDGSFMLAGGNFPTAGCWEITAQYADATLTYIIWIAP